MKYKYNGQWYDLTVPAFDSLPVGAIVGWTTNNAPDNYLICDGSAISRTTYATLFNVIGTTYGSGDGSTTFNLPNIKGRVPVGRDTSQTEFDTLGETGGSKELQEHTHTYIATTTGGGGYGVQTGSWDGLHYMFTQPNFEANGTTDATGTGDSGNLQPYIVVNYIIKAHPSAVNTSEVVNQHSTSETDVYSCNFVNTNNTYSTNETNTGKIWIDNKPIYRKVFTFNKNQYSYISGNDWYSNTITHNLNISTYTDVIAFTKRTNNIQTIIPNGNYGGLNSWSTTLGDLNTNDLSVRIGTDEYSMNSSTIIIIEYTKN